MNEALQALEIKVENGGATPQGKFFAKDWNTLVEAVKQLDLAEFDEAALNKYLKDNGYITSDDIPSTDLSNLVTLSTEQTIPGPKNFTGGIKVNGQPLIYNAELGVWELTGDLLVTGNVAWFASIKGFKPSTIMDAVQVDGETIVKNELGQLKAIGGGSGGSGGGLTVSDLSNYLTTNKYTKQSDVETLISTALTPYALTAAIPTNNSQLTNGAGYITSSALKGYATESWVTNKGYITASALTGYATEQWVKDRGYLTGITSAQVTTALGFTPYNATNPNNYISSITSKMVTDALGFTPYNSTNPDKYIKGINYDMVIAALGYTPYSTTNPMGYLTISSLNGYATEQWVGENYLAKSGGTISGTEEAVLKINTSYAVGVAVNFRVGNKSRAWVGYNTSDGAYLGYSDWGYTLRIGTDGKPYYRSYELIHANNIGSYNAGSATKLATPRTIWGQSFDGTADIAHGFRSCYAGSYNGGVAHSILNSSDPYGLLTRINGDGSVSLQAQRETNNAQCFELSLNPLGGSVLVGNVVTPKAKLHIEKTALVEYEYNHAGQALGTLYGLGVGTKSYGISMWTEGSGRGFIQQMRFDGATSVYDLCLQPFGGNVAVGRTTADAKLHVGGSIYADYDLVSTGTSKSAGGFNLSDTGESYCGLMPDRLITSSGQATDIWLYNTTKISYYASAHEIFNDVTINGNLWVNGNVSWVSQSQRSLKNIIDEQGLSLAQLERIKPIKFYWKDGRDSILHVGGVADVFAEVLPEVVSRWKDTLCLNYVDAGFYVGASLIAPVVDHERRIAQLEKENAELKQKLNQLAA